MAWIREVAIASGLTEGRVATLLDRYGTRARSVAQGCGGSRDTPLASLPDHSRGEIAWILREEFVTRLDDLILRRTLIAIRGEARAVVLEELADIAAEALRWSPARRASELACTIERLRDRHGVSVEMPRDAAIPPSPSESGQSADAKSRAVR
jgi:glycerol-3-phosphate dehydrogenase